MKPLAEFLLIACGGALGAITRYGIHHIAEQTIKKDSWFGSFPIGTFVANVAGCLLIGILIGSGRSESSQHWRMFVGVGFLGAMTTFSTFGAETVQSLEEGSWAIAGSNVLANVVFGLAAVMLGLWMGRQLVE